MPRRHRLNPGSTAGFPRTRWGQACGSLSVLAALFVDSCGYERITSMYLHRRAHSREHSSTRLAGNNLRSDPAVRCFSTLSTGAMDLTKEDMYRTCFQADSASDCGRSVLRLPQTAQARVDVAGFKPTPDQRFR